MRLAQFRAGADDLLNLEKRFHKEIVHIPCYKRSDNHHTRYGRYSREPPSRGVRPVNHIPCPSVKTIGGRLVTDSNALTSYWLNSMWLTPDASGVKSVVK